MKKTKEKLLFVDKVEHNDLGGATMDIRKAEYLLAIHGNSLDALLKKTSRKAKIPGGMFHTGRWIVAFNIYWDLTHVNFTFINYNIDLDSNFDLFADCLSPQAVQSFFDAQQIVKKKQKKNYKASNFPTIIHSLNCIINVIEIA